MSGTTALGGYMVAQKITESVLAAELVTDAVLISIDVPGDATIYDVVVSTTDCDDGATLTYDVGDTAGPDTPDDDRFIAALSGQAASVLHANIDGGLLENSHTYSNTGDTTIALTVKAGAATGADGTVSLEVIYYR